MSRNKIEFDFRVFFRQLKKFEFDLIFSDYSHLYVIAKEDASRSWQAVVGSEDPAEAAQKEPTRFDRFLFQHRNSDISFSI